MLNPDFQDEVTRVMAVMRPLVHLYVSIRDIADWQAERLHRLTSVACVVWDAMYLPDVFQSPQY